MIKENMAHADIDHSPQPHAEKSTSNTQASRMPQGSARKITANFNPMVLSEIHAAGNKDQRVSLSPLGCGQRCPGKARGRSAPPSNIEARESEPRIMSQ